MDTCMQKYTYICIGQTYRGCLCDVHIHLCSYTPYQVSHACVCVCCVYAHLCLYTPHQVCVCMRMYVLCAWRGRGRGALRYHIHNSSCTCVPTTCIYTQTYAYLIYGPSLCGRTELRKYTHNLGASLPIQIYV